MKISAKARYGLACMIYIAKHQSNGQCITLLALSSKLAISKLYLEQVFSLLKRASLVKSIKGAQGGYTLSKPPKEVRVFDIIYAIDSTLFEPTQSTVLISNPKIEQVMIEKVFSPLEKNVQDFLSNIFLSDLAAAVNTDNEDFMYYL